jgi:hypothetical protein
VNAALWRCSRTTGTRRTRRKEYRPRRPPPAVHDSGNHVSEDRKKNYSLLQYRTPSHSIVDRSVGRSVGRSMDDADVEARRNLMTDAGVCTDSRNGGVHAAFGGKATDKGVQLHDSGLLLLRLGAGAGREAGAVRSRRCSSAPRYDRSESNLESET